MENGILAVNKPDGISSARVVAHVKRALGLKKVGHTGTLDPFATGLLLVALEKGTKISQFFLNGAKQYLATVTLGVETDTYDRTGKCICVADPGILKAVRPGHIEKLVKDFIGVQEQVAPSFSALKHEGQPLYKLARQGKMIRKPPRQIEIFDMSVTRMALPEFDINVHCSSGTYIRSIAHDMGVRLGCGAHLSELCRTKCGSFDLKDAVTLDDIDRLDRAEIESRVMSMSDCLSFMPCLIADSAIKQKISHGQRLLIRDMDTLSHCCEGPGDYIRVTDSANRLLALVRPDKDGIEYNYCCVFIA